MSAGTVRWAAALLAAGFIAVVVGITSGSGGDGNGAAASTSTSPTTAATTAPTEYSNIYVVGLGSRVPYLLTGNRGREFADSPAWSRSGGIVFAETGCGPCPSRLFTMTRGYGTRKRIASDVTNLAEPAWRPDGRAVAVARPGHGIYVLDARNGRARRLTSDPSDEAPAWSPDGELILFHRQVTATNWDVYGVRPGGGGLRRVTSDGRQQLHPTWSPDGERIAFAEQHENGNWVIFSMRLDGSDREQVTEESDSSQEPAWSPDGRSIALIAQAEGRRTLAVVDAGGGSRRRLTDRSLAASAPAWSPDSRRIVFSAQEIEPGMHH